eukprot:464388_1
MTASKPKCCNGSTVVIFIFALSFTIFIGFMFPDTLNKDWYIDKNMRSVEGMKNSEHLIFFHIPKTGGKVIEQLFLHEFNIRLSKEVPTNKLLKKASRRGLCFAQHLPINWLFEMISNDTENMTYSNARNRMRDISSYYYSQFPYLRTDSFAAVRNPYARFISEYQWCSAQKICTHKLIVWLSTHCQQYLSLPIDAAFCTKLHYLRKNANFAKARGATMEQLLKTNNSIWKQFDFCDGTMFNKYAYVMLKYLIEEVYASNDKHKRAMFSCHYVKQSEYIYNYTDTSDRMTKYVLRTEHLTDDLIHLGKIYNINIDADMVTKYRDQWAWPKHCKNINPNDLNMENKKLLNELYYDDFINFNYSMIE